MSERPIGGVIRRSSGNAHGATSVSNSFTCVRLCAVDLLMCALYIHPTQADRVGVAQRDEVQPGIAEGFRQRRLRVPAVVAQFGVERTVGGLHGRHENQHASLRNQHVPERPQRRRVVLDVLEDVHAHHRIETVAGQLGSIALLEMTRAEDEPRMSLHRVLQAREAIGVRFEAHHEIGGVRQRARHRADARSHFEHALADVTSKEIEQVRAVSARLLHRLEIVGGVPLLRLTVTSIDVIRVGHVV